jgi:hypothetical protein
MHNFDYRAALILECGIGSLAICALWLLLGQLRGKYDLWQMVVDARLKQVVLRLVFELMAFIVATTVVLILTVKSDGEVAVWAFASYISVYSARSILGALAGAKTATMMHPPFDPNAPQPPPPPDAQ